MVSFAPTRTVFSPPAPQNIADLGISENLVLDLVLRRLLIEGFSSLGSLSQALRLSTTIIDAAFKHMRQQQLVEVKGMLGNDYNFTLSQAGKRLASERFQVSQYAGACPVSLAEYNAAVKAQAAKVNVDREALRHAFADLVISDRMLDQLGPAIISQNSIFRLRPHRQRKDQPRRTHAARVSGRGADSLRRRSRQPDHQPLRPGGAPDPRAGRRGNRPALAGLQAPLHSWWAAN